MCNKALMKTVAHELLELIWREVRVLPKEEFANLVPNFLFEAAKLGNAEFLIILLRSYPDLIWTVDKKTQSIFHIAVKHRQESVFNLIYKIGTIKGIIATYISKEDQINMLHLAGQLAPLARRNIIPGAPLQMQRELLWFEVGGNYMIEIYFSFDCIFDLLHFLFSIIYTSFIVGDKKDRATFIQEDEEYRWKNALEIIHNET
jgi:hypothetical protein